ncbi:FeoA family protein [Cellulosilyticum sp. I15G10I2]|uniref:FeoA family protein n=1 Tax=Cellulosilyticum sp. I15G10I2 TaxID=1892843 RepID=UPI00085C96AD|nr:FeoA family protein [Cellulosilyticum sp. I15G10I2]
MSKTLCDLPIGSTGIIANITAPFPMKQRFMDMGLVKGTSVYIEKLAPLGNPIQISFKGYSLCVRKEDAKYILIA